MEKLERALRRFASFSIATVLAACGAGGADQIGGGDAAVGDASQVSPKSLSATPLAGRDINGIPVDAYDSSAVFLYDADADVTWLRDASAISPGSWASANAAAASLTVGAFGGWRLPEMIDTGTAGCNFAYTGTDCGFNVQRGRISPPLAPNPLGVKVYSELAHLFYDVLGNIPWYDETGVYQPNHTHGVGPFLNGGNFLGYCKAWFGTRSLVDGSVGPWAFNWRSAYQQGPHSSDWGCAFFVRPGDVAKHYTVDGFAPPVSNAPAVNAAHAGSVVPLKWSVKNPDGTSVRSLSAIRTLGYAATSCSAFSAAPGALVVPESTGGGLRLTGGSFHFNWKVPSVPGCYVVVMILDSGQTLSANVQVML